MIKVIVKKSSQILRQKCSQVYEFNKIQEAIDDNDFARGIGLAAPQIGETYKISVAEYDGKRYVLVNPEIVEKSDKITPIREGCISFFEYRAMVPRYEEIKVKAFDRNGKQYFIQAKGDFAMLLQHEIDHLDGILYIDHLPNKEKDLFLK